MEVDSAAGIAANVNVIVVVRRKREKLDASAALLLMDRGSCRRRCRVRDQGSPAAPAENKWPSVNPSQQDRQYDTGTSAAAVQYSSNSKK